MRFGIISTADIGVNSFVPAVGKSEHEVAAIASRTRSTAESIADDLDIPTAYGSYDPLLDDESLDAVYIPLPNGFHAEWIHAAANAGLHVLCEKPLTASAAETAAAFDHCEEQDVVLMEAFMYRFHPLTERAAEIAETELGEIRNVTSTFTFRMPNGAEDIRLDPDLDGGSVMDVGTYAINAARLFLGEPDRVYATTEDRRGVGVDTEMTGILEYPSGATARLGSGFETALTQYYRVEATDGWLRVDPSFDIDVHTKSSLTYSVNGCEVTETFDPADHYRLEVESFADRIESGESLRVDGRESVAHARVVDAVYESADVGRPIELDRAASADP